MVFEMMERDEATRQRFMERLDKYLTRADDRALFDLQVMPTESPKKEIAEG
jgi:large subunit ribosomal protein L7/L12